MASLLSGTCRALHACMGELASRATAFFPQGGRGKTLGARTTDELGARREQSSPCAQAQVCTRAHAVGPTESGATGAYCWQVPPRETSMHLQHLPTSNASNGWRQPHDPRRWPGWGKGGVDCQLPSSYEGGHVVSG